MCVYFYMFLMVMSSCYTVTGQPQVMGSQPVLAKVGDNVILPCHIKPPVNMERKTLEWKRPDLKPEFALLLQDGRYIADELNPLYQRRTSLFHEELQHGNISLKLSRVKLSDEGTYKCFVPHLKSSTLIQLLVGSVSHPVISSNGPSLTCDSGCWYPEPEMSWLDGDGTLLSAEPSVTDKPSQHCYIVQSNVTVTQATDLTCRVHLPHINHTADIQRYISDDMIPTGGSSGGVIAGIVILVIFIILVSAVLGYLYWKNKQAGQDPNPIAYQQGAAAAEDPEGEVFLDAAAVDPDLNEQLLTGRSMDQLGTTSPKPRAWIQTSKTWREKLENLANIDDCEVIKVGRCVFVKDDDEFLIGEGNKGTEVYLGLTDDGTEVAVKKITKLIYKELEYDEGSKQLYDPLIVRYVDFAKDEYFGYLALQLCEYNLEQYITKPDKRFSEPELAHQVLNSLSILHGQNPPILHRGLKPQNVLIDTDGKARLADFGIIQQPKRRTHTGTAEGERCEQCWMAKEMMGEHKRNPDKGAETPVMDDAYTRSSDIQVAGMLIYYILSGGEHPFGDGYRCKHNIHKAIYNLDRVQDVEAKRLIDWMINADPKERPTVEDCLGHPFFWSNQRRVEYLRTIGNQQEVVSPPDDDLIKALDQYAEQGQFNTWKHKFPHELVQKMDGLKSYPENSFGLLHFIHNLHEHHAEDAAHIDLMEMFPGLVGGVYKFAKEQGWNSSWPTL